MIARTDSVDLRRMQLLGSSSSSAAAAVLPSRGPVDSIIWRGAARTALNATVRCSLVARCTHRRRGGFQHAEERIAKCTRAASIPHPLLPPFSLQHKQHTVAGVFARVDAAHLCVSVLLRVFITPQEWGGSALAAVLQPHSVFFCSGGKAEVARRGGLTILCGSERVRECVEVRAAALSLRTSRLCHSCSGGRGVNSCRRR